MKLFSFVAVLALSIVLYVDFRSQPAADTRSVSLPIIEQADSAPPAPPMPPLGPEPEPIHTSPYVPFLEAGVYHSNGRALFDEHIDLAENGNADSMLIIAEVTDGCVAIGSFKTWDDFAAATPIVQSGQMPTDMQDEFKSIFDRMGADCSYVNAHAPEHRYSEWAGDWNKKAAANGNVAARLRMLLIGQPSEDKRQSMAVLLNDAVTPTDFRLNYLASEFLVNYPIADSNVADSLRYLGCTHDPEWV